METKEQCIRCGKETEYDINTPITVRRYFVEGAGQLCEACFHKLYPVPTAFENKNCSDFVQKRDNDATDNIPTDATDNIPNKL